MRVLRWCIFVCMFCSLLTGIPNVRRVQLWSAACVPVHGSTQPCGASRFEGGLKGRVCTARMVLASHMVISGGCCCRNLLALAADVGGLHDPCMHGHCSRGPPALLSAPRLVLLRWIRPGVSWHCAPIESDVHTPHVLQGSWSTRNCLLVAHTPFL